MRNIRVRQVERRDLEQLERWRQAFKDGSLDLPHGYMAPGLAIESCVAEKNGVLLGGMTGTIVASIDPLIRNPEASPLDMMTAIVQMETVLAYVARNSGAVDAYIAVPNVLPDYQRIVEKCGYQRTVQNCSVYRKPLVPDLVSGE